jgi:hypothetical protein
MDHAWGFPQFLMNRTERRCYRGGNINLLEMIPSFKDFYLVKDIKQKITCKAITQEMSQMV